MTWRAFLKPLCVALLLLILPFGLWHVPALQHVLQHMREWCHLPWAPAWFLLFAIPYCAVGLSRQALCLAAGAGFGVMEALLLCSVAYEVGAFLGYGWGRVVVARRGALRSSMMGRIQGFLQMAPFRAVLGLRLMPLGSALLVSVTAGAVRLPWGAFALATLLGGLPQNMVFVLAGGGVRIGHRVDLLLASGLFVASTILGISLLRRYRSERRVERF